MRPTRLNLSATVGLPTPIEIKFFSSSRVHTRAEMLHEPSQSWEEVEQRYAAIYQMDLTVTEWVTSIYPEAIAKKDLIISLAQQAIAFADSKYGYGAEDYDAKLTIS